MEMSEQDRIHRQRSVEKSFGPFGLQNAFAEFEKFLDELMQEHKGWKRAGLGVYQHYTYKKKEISFSV